MALPPLPGGGLPERPRPASSGLPALPNLSAPREPQISPALAPYVAQFAKKFGRQPNAIELERIALAVQKKAAQENAPTPPALPQQQATRPASAKNDDWLVDKETGKRYKRMPGFKQGVMASKSTVKSIAARGASLQELRTMIEDAPDFTLDDLNGSAELFMAHLRVAPDKEEQQKLAAERLARQKMFDAIASREAEEEELADD